MKVLCFDIGGTKIAAACVDTNGTVLFETKAPTPVLSWNEAKSLITRMGHEILATHPEIKACGISSAGPLHSESGMILNPTNMKWGEVPICQELSREFKIPVVLENDAASAVLAEHWMGEHKNTESLLMLTLGTGMGVGAVVNHRLVRGGRGFHPETSHIILDVNEKEVLCGCGNYGCAESFLGGSYFLKRAQIAYQNPEMTIDDFLKTVATRDPRTLKLYDIYSLRLAQFIYNHVLLTYPYHVVLGGSASASAENFLPKAQEHLEKFLWQKPRDWIPKISISKLSNAGLLGAARIALKRLDPRFQPESHVL
jgi:glucokinase